MPSRNMAKNVIDAIRFDCASRCGIGRAGNMIRAAAALIVLLFAGEVRPETVDVKYRGTVDLKTFECRDINRSSFIQRVCYDKAQSYMIISLKGVYYHYCEFP